MCEFQARLRSEEVSRHLLLQQLQQRGVQEKTAGGGAVQTSASPNGELTAARQPCCDACSVSWV